MFLEKRKRRLVFAILLNERISAEACSDKQQHRRSRCDDALPIKTARFPSEGTLRLRQLRLSARDDPAFFENGAADPFPADAFNVHVFGINAAKQRFRFAFVRAVKQFLNIVIIHRSCPPKPF